MTKRERQLQAAEKIFELLDNMDVEEAERVLASVVDGLVCGGIEEALSDLEDDEVISEIYKGKINLEVVENGIENIIAVGDKLREIRRLINEINETPILVKSYRVN